MRIGLHAGPGYVTKDPVTGGPAFMGAHVNHAARIEPAAAKNEAAPWYNGCCKLAA